MKELINLIDITAQAELNRANEIWPQFHSKHEGLGVLSEEVWEMREELKKLDKFLDELQMAVFNDFDCEKALNGAERSLAAGLAEGIQAIAMMKKFRCLLEREVKKNG